MNSIHTSEGEFFSVPTILSRSVGIKDNVMEAYALAVLQTVTSTSQANQQNVSLSISTGELLEEMKTKGTNFYIEMGNACVDSLKYPKNECVRDSSTAATGEESIVKDRSEFPSGNHSKITNSPGLISTDLAIQHEHLAFVKNFKRFRLTRMHDKLCSNTIMNVKVGNIDEISSVMLVMQATPSNASYRGNDGFVHDMKSKDKLFLRNYILHKRNKLRKQGEGFVGCRDERENAAIIENLHPNSQTTFSLYFRKYLNDEESDNISFGLLCKHFIKEEKKKKRARDISFELSNAKRLQNLTDTQRIVYDVRTETYHDVKHGVWFDRRGLLVDTNASLFSPAHAFDELYVEDIATSKYSSEKLQTIENIIIKKGECREGKLNYKESAKICACVMCENEFLNLHALREHIKAVPILTAEKAFIKGDEEEDIRVEWQEGYPGDTGIASETYRGVHFDDVFLLNSAQLCRARDMLRRHGVFFSQHLLEGKLGPLKEEVYRRHLEAQKKVEVYVEDFFVDGKPRNGEVYFPTRPSFEFYVIPLKREVKELLQKIFPEYVITYQDHWDKLRIVKGHYHTVLHADHTLQHRFTDYDTTNVSFVTTWISLNSSTAKEGLSFFFPRRMSGQLAREGIWGAMNATEGSISIFLETTPHACFSAKRKLLRMSCEMRWAVSDRTVKLGKELQENLCKTHPRILSCGLCQVYRFEEKRPSWIPHKRNWIFSNTVNTPVLMTEDMDEPMFHQRYRFHHSPNNHSTREFVLKHNEIDWKIQISRNGACRRSKIRLVEWDIDGKRSYACGLQVPTPGGRKKEEKQKEIVEESKQYNRYNYITQFDKSKIRDHFTYERQFNYCYRRVTSKRRSRDFH